MHNLLVKEGIEVISEDSEFIHVSGHPNREDLKDMYNWIKPKSVIPVHGEHRHMIEHINFAKEMQVPYLLKINRYFILVFRNEIAEKHCKFDLRFLFFGVFFKFSVRDQYDTCFSKSTSCFKLSIAS